MVKSSYIEHNYFTIDVLNNYYCVIIIIMCLLFELQWSILSYEFSNIKIFIEIFLCMNVKLL